MGLYFNSAEEAQQAYDSFADKYTNYVHEHQTFIKDILEGKIPRTGETIDKALKQGSELERELVASLVGNINQAKKAVVNELYTKEDNKRLSKDLLPRGKTYCCVMKEPIPSRNEDIEQAGLKEGDLQILFRLIPCVGYNTGILLNPDNGFPFITYADIAEYLGEKPIDDGKVANAMRRLIKEGIVWRYGGMFIMNDDFIRCGQMTTGVLQKRREKRQAIQGKKPINKQGKKAGTKKTKNDIAEEPQTQATSGQGIFEEIPF